MPRNPSFQQTPDPCAQLAVAKAQMALLLSGQSVSVIETPQLGRVEFAKTDVADLRRWIDQLTEECAAASGQTMMVRKPLSYEACP